MLCNSSPQVVQFVSSSCATRLLKLCASPLVVQHRLLKLCSSSPLVVQYRLLLLCTCLLLLCGCLLLLCTCLLLLCTCLLLLCTYFSYPTKGSLLKVCSHLSPTPTVSVPVTSTETVSGIESVPDTSTVSGTDSVSDTDSVSSGSIGAPVFGFTKATPRVRITHSKPVVFRRLTIAFVL